MTNSEEEWVQEKIQCLPLSILFSESEEIKGCKFFNTHLYILKVIFKGISTMAQSCYVKLKIVFSVFDLRDIRKGYSFKTKGKNSFTQPE